MKPSTFLKRLNINPDEPILLITAEEAMEKLFEAIEKYCPNLKINEMSKKDLLALFNSYGDCIIDYHPENYHQERAALLQNIEMLRRCGLTDNDHNFIDFC
jgi:alpha-L-fucosidase